MNFHKFRKEDWKALMTRMIVVPYGQILKSKKKRELKRK